MKLHSVETPYSDYDRWVAICPPDKWCTPDMSSLEGIIHPKLLAKSNSVFVMVSATGNKTVVLANLNRVDKSALDQHPYIAIFDHDQSAANAAYLDHGTWPNRTTYPGQEFLDTISASGIHTRYPLEQMPSGTSGNLHDLSISSQSAAFWNAISATGLR